MTDSTVIAEYGSAKLVIGNARAAADATLFETYAFGLVVNCTPDLPFLDCFVNDRVRLPVLDIGELRDTMALYSMLPGVLPRIDEAINAGRSVLVHCHAGRQRSAAVTAAYLMVREGLDRDAAIAAVRAKRREAFWPNANFYGALE
jgi:Dual specificity phosphatase, catalytic domain